MRVRDLSASHRRKYFCQVIAASLIPTNTSDRVKTDRRDARQLARLFRAGELTAIYVPDEEDEAVRALMSLRGVAMINGKTLVAEAGDFSPFDDPRSLMHC